MLELEQAPKVCVVDMGVDKLQRAEQRRVADDPGPAMHKSQLA